MTNAAPILPDGREARSLEIARVKIRLRLRQAAQCGFQHGGHLRRLLNRLPGAPPPSALLPLALESGHVRYQEGDAYDLVLTAVGQERHRLGSLVEALRALGRERNPPATGLEGRFELESCEPLPRLALAEARSRAARLAARGQVRIHLLSPLRLGISTEGASFLSPRVKDKFPSGLFLAGLRQRYRHLAGDAEPDPDPLPMPADTRIRAERLTRLDLPLDLGRPDRPVPTHLGGLCGTLVAENLPQPWLLLLVLMEDAHIGTGTEYGFGAFALEEKPAYFRPAATYEEKLWLTETHPKGAAEALAPAAMALLDEGPAFYRRGLSRLSAEGGLRKAREQGLNGPVGGAGDRFVARLAEAEVMARLEALWPGEPLVKRFGAWLKDPEERALLTRLLAKLFAVELADALQEEGRRLVRVGSELRVLGRHAARVA